MTCDHADCVQPATIRCRMGDGWIRMPGYEKRQTYAHYCDDDFQTVERLFTLCDVEAIRPMLARDFLP